MYRQDICIAFSLPLLTFPWWQSGYSVRFQTESYMVRIAMSALGQRKRFVTRFSSLYPGVNKYPLSVNYGANLRQSVLLVQEVIDTTPMRNATKLEISTKSMDLVALKWTFLTFHQVSHPLFTKKCTQIVRPCLLSCHLLSLRHGWVFFCLLFFLCFIFFYEVSPPPIPLSRMSTFP